LTNLFKEAGTYRLVAEELTRQGGPRFQYHLMLETLPGGFSLGTAIERASVPAGDTCEIEVKAQRRDYDGPIQLALAGLDELPADGREHGVEMHGLQARPVRFHVLGARGTGVAELAAQHQEGLAVDDQLLCVAVFFQAGRRGRRQRGGKQQGGSGEQVFHRGPSGIGSLWGFAGIGLLAGGAIGHYAGTRVTFAGYKRTITVAYLLHGATYMLFSQAESYAAALVLMMFSRVGMAVTTVLNNAQLLRHTPNEFRGRVFSTMESIRWSVMIVSMAAAGIAHGDVTAAASPCSAGR